MKPGIARGTLVGLIGFLVGFGFVVALRWIFDFMPYVDVGMSLIMATFSTAFAFVWGMGGLGAEMNQHPDDNAPPIDLEEEALRVGPGGIVANTTWYVGFATILILLIIAVLVVIPTVPITVTETASGSVNQFGSFEVPFISDSLRTELFGESGQVNQIFVLIGFILFTLVSLAITGGILGWVITALDEQVQTVEALPAGAAPTRVNRLQRGVGSIAGQLASAIREKDSNLSDDPERFDPMLPEGKSKPALEAGEADASEETNTEEEA